MVERDSCYFCTSPFQLFAILALACDRKESADLYIDPQFAEASLFVERIRQTGIFMNVAQIDSKSIYDRYLSASPGLVNHLQIANTYLHVEDIARCILLDGVVYRNIFLSSKAYLPRMVQLSYIRVGRSFNTYYFDDGAGTYEKDRAYRISGADGTIRRVLFGKQAIYTDYDRFVFSPNLYNTLNPGHTFAVRGIRRFWENGQGGETVNRVFGISEQPRIDERVIILDQPKDELFSQEGIAEINGIYRELADAVGRDNVIVKRHPRSSTKDFGDLRYFEGNGVPFELYCLNMDMSKKVIVSFTSTAVATPKILFDQEPIVIVLSKLVKTNTGEKNLFVDYFEAVKKTYNESIRFFIPRDRDEFREFVSSLNNTEYYDE